MDLSTPMADGVVHSAYTNPRPEVSTLVPPRCHRVLDVGCSVGAMGATLRAASHEVLGIESDPQLAAEARTRLDGVIEADVEELAREDKDPGGPFDCIVLADVLEHLRDPWSVVRWGARLLGNDGVIVASVPNVRHAETFWALAVKARWPYKDVGIFDRTHLRFFARRNLPSLFDGTDLEIAQLRRHYRLRLDPTSRWNHLSPLLGDLGTLQFLVLATRRHPAGLVPSR